MKVIPKNCNDEERVINVCVGMMGILIVVFTILFMK